MAHLCNPVACARKVKEALKSTLSTGGRVSLWRGAQGNPLTGEWLTKGGPKGRPHNVNVR